MSAAECEAERRGSDSRSYPVVDEVPEEHCRGKGPSWVHASTCVVHLQHKTISLVTDCIAKHSLFFLLFYIFPCVLPP